MKTIQEWFDEYSESHQDPTNKLMHWVCVPTIYFSIIGILANFSVLLAALVFILALIFLCAFRCRISHCNGYPHLGHGMAYFSITEGL